MTNTPKTQKLTDAELDGVQGGLLQFEIQDVMKRKRRDGVVDHKADDFMGKTGVVDHKAED